MKKSKRLWESILLALCVLLIGIYMICGNLYKASAEAADPYDWSDDKGEVILDDPMYFLNTEDKQETTPDDSAGENSGGQAEDESDEVDVSSDSPVNTDQPDPVEDKPDTPVDEPGELSTDEPAQTEEPPAPIDLKTMFKVEIKVPADWTNAMVKNVRIKVTPLTGSAWDKVKYKLDGGDWVEIKEKFTLLDGYYYVALEVTDNVTMTVRLLDSAGNYLDEKKEIRIFDRLAPVVTAGFNDKLLHVEAPDDLSGAAGVQVNGLLFTTLENGKMDVRMEDTLLTYPQLAIRAYDYAGNFSEPITLDNPYYAAPTPTPKATKKPTAKPTATTAPTEAPKATKKPAGGTTKVTDSPVAVTSAPVVTQESAAPAVTPEPIVIVVTQEPMVTPEPIVKTEYVPIGPGQPFTSNGNMQTLDVLYSAATNKQFITVQSKKGQTYFLVIDYDKPIDEANEIYETYFLNLVDDRDLLSVLTDEEIVATPTPQIVYITPEPTAVPVVTAEPAPQPEKPAAANPSGLLLLLIVLLGGGGAAYWYFNKKKNNIPKNRMMDESGFDDEDEDESENNNE
ncbi:MAG: DUF4366 domain-containing protein [Clostridia bacterium]|nr:DUF4366 domain-containing protein [Clostridia bacterium]